MSKILSNISLDVDTNNDGTYNIYLATENSSGESYKNISADEIGKHVANLIDSLEEADSGKSYLLHQKTTKTVLVHTDGYSINHRTYANYQAAKTAMKEEYAQHNHNTVNDDWDKLSYIDDYNAVLYDNGENVYVWQIVEV